MYSTRNSIPCRVQAGGITSVKRTADHTKNGIFELSPEMIWFLNKTFHSFLQFKSKTSASLPPRNYYLH